MPILRDSVYACTLLPHLVYHRLITRKYGPRAHEKLGYVLPRAGEAPCLWVHAVSVGETLAARTLVRAFREARPSWDLRFSTTTATGREVAEKNFAPEEVFYYPLDLSWVVRRTWERIRPSLIVLMELEVWPGLMAQAAAQGTPVVVCNARITELSTRRFRRFRVLTHGMLEQVTLWCAQSEAYADRLRSLGVRPERIEVVGSVKYDTVPTTVDPAVRAAYRQILGAEDGTPVIIGGSTHPSEEEALLKATDGLRQQGFPGLKLVLVPRHPERLEAVERLAQGHGAVTRRSAIAPGDRAATPIVLVDTMGELGKLYAAADAVFVGGSLIPHGGQNMMEPCGLGRPTVIGSSAHNFVEPVAVLRACDGLRQIDNAADLLPVLREFLAKPEAAAAMGARARDAMMAQKGATERTLSCLRRCLPRVTE